MKPIPEVITTAGWKYREKCRCAGILKYKFGHPSQPSMILEWWVLYSKFRVFNKNKLMIPATALSKFNEAWTALN